MTNIVLLDADGVVNDGTLLDLSAFGVPAEAMGPFFTGRFQECLVGRADLLNELAVVAPEWGWSGTPEELMKHWFESQNKIDAVVVGAVETLRGAGIPVYLGTNQEKYRTEYMKTTMGYGALFDGVFSSADIGDKKPNRGYFAAVYKAIGEPDPKNVIFWDDTPSYAKGGEEFGFTTHLFRGNEDFLKKMKEYFPQL